MKDGDRRYRLSSDVVLDRQPQGAVILDTRAGRYWEVNATTVDVLALLGEGHALASVAGTIADGSDADRERVERDVADIVRTLVRARILTRVRR